MVPSQPAAAQPPLLNQVLADAIGHHLAGRLPDAELLYRSILLAPSPHAQANFGLGLLCSAQGRVADAIAAYQRAIAIHPAYVDAYVNLAATMLAVGRPAEAVELCRQALAIAPDNATALNNLGKALQDLGQFQAAIDAYRTSIARCPDNALAHLNLGGVLLDRGAWEQAEVATRCALSFEPGNLMARVNLAATLMHLGRPEEALAACHQALALNPADAAVQVTLGGAMMELGALSEAVALCEAAIRQNPRLPHAFFNLSHAYRGLNALDRAEAAARQAVSLLPNSAEYHFHLGQILLLRGDFEAGWAEYDWRWRMPDFAWFEARHGALPQPIWMGEDISHKTILVYAEQGLGDIIQFARYLPMLVSLAGKVIVAAQPPLHRLLGTIANIHVIPIDEALPEFDVRCPLMSLPRAFGTRVETIPGTVPYLHVDAVERTRWAKRIDGKKLRVGIVWAGNPRTRRDRIRSPGLAAVAPLFELPDIDFVVLQVGPGRIDIGAKPLPPNVLDLGAEVTDLVDTAAIMAGLDVMISSCTGPLHLAGALGVPVWAMIPFAPHFPWLLDRTDTPWYPTMRLYRQNRPGLDWSGVTDRIASDLAAMTGRMPSP
jgi:tetratricopeptide (TPR) repeat protein